MQLPTIMDDSVVDVPENLSKFDSFVASRKTMKEQDISALGERFQVGVNVKDRRWYLKVYPNCFVGKPTKPNEIHQASRS